MSDSVKVDIEIEEKEALKTIEKFIKKLKKAENAAEDVEESAKKAGDGVKKSFGQSFGLDKLGKSLKDIKKNFFDLSGAVDVFKGVALANLISGGFRILTEVVGETIDEFMAFEKALIGVQKTTSLSGKELDKFVKDVQQLSKEIPVSQTELLNLAGAAGQLGVDGAADLLKFTETVSKLTVATDLAGEEGAKSLVRILNTTGEGVGNIDRFAASIVALGNSTAATESEIVNVANEVGRATAAFNISSDAVAGISASLKALGVRAELGGTVVGKTFREISKIIEAGGQKFEKLTKLTGMSGDAIKQAYEKDSLEAFKIFINGLGNVEGGAVAVTKTLEDFGLTGEGVAKVLPVLAQRADLLEKSLKTSADAFRENTALADEAEAAYNTLESQTDRLANIISVKLTNAFTPLGEAVRDFIKEINDELDGINTIEELTPILEKVTGKVEYLQGLIASREATGDGQGAITENLREQLRLYEEERKSLVGIRNEITKNQRAQEDGSLLLRPESGGGADPLDNSVNDYLKTDDELLAKRQARFKAEVEASKEKNDAIVADEVETNAELTAVDTEFMAQAALRAEQLNIENEEAALRQKEVTQRLSEDELQRLNQIQLEKIALQKTSEMQRTNLIQNEEKRRLAQQKIAAKTELELVRQNNKNKLEDTKRAHKEEQGSISSLFDFEKNTQGSRAQMFKSSLSVISGLQKSGSKELFMVGKAAAIGQATIDGIAAVQKALASVPPPFNFALAATVGAATAANVANIASQKPAGYEFGGYVGGSSFTGDSQIIAANSGERVLTTSEQRNIVDGVAKGTVQGGGQMGDQIGRLADAIASQQIVLTVDGREIAKTTRDASTDGYKIL